jgi:hypothetical protein
MRAGQAFIPVAPLDPKVWGMVSVSPYRAWCLAAHGRTDFSRCADSAGDRLGVGDGVLVNILELPRAAKERRSEPDKVGMDWAI